MGWTLDWEYKKDVIVSKVIWQHKHNYGGVHKHKK